MRRHLRDIVGLLREAAGYLADFILFALCLPGMLLIILCNVLGLTEWDEVEQ